MSQIVASHTLYNMTDRVQSLHANGKSYRFEATTPGSVGKVAMTAGYAKSFLAAHPKVLTDDLSKVPGQPKKVEAAPKTDFAPTIAHLNGKELIGAIRLLSLGAVASASIAKLSEEELRIMAIELAGKL